MITQVKECMESLADFRRKRRRCLDYTYGRQWNDIIEVDGRKISEYEYILREGNVPLKNNLIRRIVRNVLGVFRGRLPDYMKEFYDADLAAVAEGNSMEELFCRTMEEFLISGMAVHRKRLGYFGDIPGVFTEIVSPGDFFFNTDSRDPRGRDLEMVGQCHRVGFNEWCRAFVEDKIDFEKASLIFKNRRATINVTEVWRKETTGRYLMHDRATGRLLRLSEEEYRKAGAGYRLARWELTDLWRYYFLTDDGNVLYSGDSPFADGSHPYVMKCYPFLDGEIQSFVGDMIDQQRYTNRLITLYDWVIRASAKGVLLIPEGAVDPADLRGVADQWSRFNGVIVYKAKPENPEPRQINSNVANLGISELLEIQLKMMEDVSGVNGILQGNISNGNVSGTLYESQTANAMCSLEDFLATFRIFIKDCAAKDRMLLAQTQGKEISQPY